MCNTCKAEIGSLDINHFPCPGYLDTNHFSYPAAKAASTAAKAKEETFSGAFENVGFKMQTWIDCYGHQKSGPCNVISDVSYEELRVAAYDDAKRGLNLQLIAISYPK
nr:zinc finger CCCH domain-containing protein 16-like isoform X1 [Ipomoea batatas]GMD37015.1 zinc finger CCCH domain-containing protein 16-like isoform X1 [Ipomoea batatas]